MARGTLGDTHTEREPPLQPRVTTTQTPRGGIGKGLTGGHFSGVYPLAGVTVGRHVIVMVVGPLT